MLELAIAAVFLIATIDTGDPQWAIAAGLFAVAGVLNKFLAFYYEGDEYDQ